MARMRIGNKVIDASAPSWDETGMNVQLYCTHCHAKITVGGEVLISHYEGVLELTCSVCSCPVHIHVYDLVHEAFRYSFYKECVEPYMELVDGFDM